MNDTPKVSVIIPIYNSSKYLSETLDSVISQAYQNFEIVAIDDGSRDNSREIVEKYAAVSPSKIRYFYQDNKGIAGARNAGIKNARGEFIALLDADDKWLPERLNEGMRIFESSPEISLTHANIMLISENGEFLSVPKREEKYLSGHIFEYLFLRKADISALTVLFKKECCDLVGLFDENPVCMGVDDRDLWLRISKEYKIKYIDKVLGCHRVHKTNYSNNSEKMVTARFYVVDKMAPLEGGNRRLRNQAVSRIYRDLGDEFLLKMQFAQARQNYLKSIGNDPFYFWAWVNLVKAMLGIKVKR